MVNGKQCTITWHVDNLKILHVDPDVVISVIASIDDKFGKLEPLTVTRGKQHEYLGINLDYRQKGKVLLSMIPYIQ